MGTGANCFGFHTVVTAGTPQTCSFSLPPQGLQVREFPPQPREQPASLNPSSYHPAPCLPPLQAGTNSATHVCGRRPMAGSHWACDGAGLGKRRSAVSRV